MVVHYEWFECDGLSGYMDYHFVRFLLGEVDEPEAQPVPIMSVAFA